MSYISKYGVHCGSTHWRYIMLDTTVLLYQGTGEREWKGRVRGSRGGESMGERGGMEGETDRERGVGGGMEGERDRERRDGGRDRQREEGWRDGGRERQREEGWRERDRWGMEGWRERETERGGMEGERDRERRDGGRQRQREEGWRKGDREVNTTLSSLPATPNTSGGSREG